MMHQHDAEQLAPAELVQQWGELPKLLGAETSGRHQWTCRQCARQADERERTAPAHEREPLFAPVSAHVLSPVDFRLPIRAAHIGVVISRNESYFLRRAERFKPSARGGKFAR